MKLQNSRNTTLLLGYLEPYAIRTPAAFCSFGSFVCCLQSAHEEQTVPESHFGRVMDHVTIRHLRSNNTPTSAFVKSSVSPFTLKGESRALRCIHFEQRLWEDLRLSDGMPKKGEETILFIEDMKQGKQVVQTVKMVHVPRCVYVCVCVCVFKYKKPVDWIRKACVPEKATTSDWTPQGEHSS